MDKLPNKGYTLASIVIIMAVLSLSSLWSIRVFRVSYETFALRSASTMVTSMLMQVKYEAFLNRERQKVCFLEDYMEYQGKKQMYPNGINISNTQCFSYNEQGNINQGGTITLHGKKRYIEIVLEIGGGYYEVREIKDL